MKKDAQLIPSRIFEWIKRLTAIPMIPLLLFAFVLTLVVNPGYYSPYKTSEADFPDLIFVFFICLASSIIVINIMALVGNAANLRQSQAVLFGMVAFLQYEILTSFGQWLIGTPDFVFNDWFQLVLIPISLSIWLGWLCFSARALSVSRVICLLGVAAMVHLSDLYLGQGPWDNFGNVRRMGTWDEGTRIEYLKLNDYIDYAYLCITTLLCGLLGYIARGALKNSDPLATLRPYFQFKIKNLITSRAFSCPAIIVGVLACSFLIGLFCADNSQVVVEQEYSRFSPFFDLPSTKDGLTEYVSSFVYVVSKFDYPAIMAALSGIIQAVPFILGGAGLVWLLGRFEFNGLLPILGLGAAGGYGWHLIYPSYGYWTPFLDVGQSAMLIGMIGATCFAAIAQIVDYRMSKRLTPLTQ